MYNINLTDANATKTEVIGLVVECPIGGNPAACQLSRIRKLSLQDRTRWVNSLSYPDHVEIYLKHKKCLAAQEKSLS